MWQAERHTRILALLDTFGQVGVDRVQAELGVSRETVRRDLKELEEMGALRRVHGGALSVREQSEAPYRYRAQRNLCEKRAVGAACARLVRSGETLLIDAGSTTACLAESLAALGGLLIFTNSVDVAAHLGTEASRARQNRVVLLGGDFAADPPSTRGAGVVAAIGLVAADIAFAAPFGLTGREGATSFIPDEAEIARAMFAHASRRVVLADHSKLGHRGRVSFARPDEVDHIVLNAEATRSEHFTALRQSAGPRLIIA